MLGNLSPLEREKKVFVLQMFPQTICCTFVESLKYDAREWNGGSVGSTKKV